MGRHGAGLGGEGAAAGGGGGDGEGLLPGGGGPGGRAGPSTSWAEYDDDYWEKSYCLWVDRIPTFLHQYADTILCTGKYLNVIQQCDKAAR